MRDVPVTDPPGIELPSNEPIATDRAASLTVDGLSAMLALYDEGRLIDAYRLSLNYGPIARWRGPAARVMAGRLAYNLGAPKLGATLHRLAYRESPDEPEVLYYYARELLERRGPLQTWEFVLAKGDLDQASSDQRADWYSLHGMLLGSLRDFDEANVWLDRAEALNNARPWLCIERADLLERQDRYAEALVVARRSLELRPWYRPGVQQVARLLQLLDRDRQALDLLVEAADRLQSAPVVLQLAGLQIELALYPEARRSFERVLELSPLMEKPFLKYMAARRSDAAYYCGDTQAAIQFGKESENPFHLKVAQKLESAAADARRVLLPVPFVRQHHMTCAPATLSAISRFWSMPAEHLEVAEQICFDGTPAHSERQWAVDSGYVAREFTVTWASAVALIDRGIPFTLTTVETLSAHLQACIGYDALRGTLIIRDPFLPLFSEFVSEPFFERYKSSGPRGMAMVPASQADLLSGIDLPDADVYDVFHDLQQSLNRHARSRAGEALAQLTQRWPTHRLTHWSRRTIASYDGNLTQQLSAVDELQKLFPDDQGLTLSKINMLRSLGRREERIALLRDAGTRKGADPVFWSQLGHELRDDARQHPEAIRLLRKALRFMRGDGGSYYILAGLYWECLRRDESLALNRFAATLDEKNAAFARSWLLSARYFKRTSEVIHTLRQRFERTGKKSAQPAANLVWAYEELDLYQEASDTLDAALLLRPEDGDLLLLAANYHARHGAIAKANDYLAAARDKCRSGAFLRGSAEIAQIRGESARALELWQSILANEPLAMDAHRWVARLLAEQQSPAAAIEHMQAACARFPHSYPLHQLWVERLRDVEPQEAEQVIRKVIDLDPADAWAKRELVDVLLRQNQTQEALTQALTACQLDPTNPSSHYYLGKTHWRSGRIDEAKTALRRAVELSVDAEFAVHDLYACCRSIAERKVELEFVWDELVRQTIFGDGLLAYRNLAVDILEPAELLSRLERALAARADLWHAWAAVVAQLAAMNRLDDAAKRGREATQRFPLMARLWVELASVYRLRGDIEPEMESLRQALLLAPGWSYAVRTLSEAYNRVGRFPEARQMLEQAVVRAPLDPFNQGCLADLLWRLGEKEQAVERATRGANLDPGYGWAWDALNRWTTELGRPEAGIAIARELAGRRAGESRSWLILARMLTDPSQRQERLDAIDKALTLNPRSIDANEQRVRVLTEMERYADAESACRPAIFGADIPLELRAREAWLQARRDNLPRAIELMRPILQEDPGFYWGWGQLSDWLGRSGDKAGRLDALKTMVGVWPHDASLYGRLGDAFLENKDRASAKAAYRHAIRLAPDDDYAGFQLFDFQLEDNELADAQQTLALLKSHAPGAYTFEREIELAAKKGDSAFVTQGVAKLAHMPMRDDLWPLKAAIDVASRMGKTREIETLLFQAAVQPGVYPYVAEYLVRKRIATADDPLAALPLVDSLEPYGEVGVEALACWFSQSAMWAVKPLPRTFSQTPVSQLHRRWTWLRSRPLLRELHRRRQVLRANDKLWGVGGYALHTIRNYYAVVDWLSDWQTRKRPESWMLVNIGEAYRALGNLRQSHEVHVEASRLGGGHPRGIHLLWLAADAMLDNDLPAAGPFLTQAKDLLEDENYQRLTRVFEGVLTILREPGDAASTAAARKQIDLAISEHATFRKDREVRRTFLLLVKKIAAAATNWPTRWWCWKKTAELRTGLRL